MFPPSGHFLVRNASHIYYVMRVLPVRCCVTTPSRKTASGSGWSDGGLFQTKPLDSTWSTKSVHCQITSCLVNQQMCKVNTSPASLLLFVLYFVTRPPRALSPLSPVSVQLLRDSPGNFSLSPPLSLGCRPEGNNFTISGRGRNFLSKMWLGSGGVSPAIAKPDLSGQHDILFNDLYQEVRCAAPSAQVKPATEIAN